MKEFRRLTSETLSGEIEAFAHRGPRRITALHLHHTWQPTAALYRSLVGRLGDGESAARELCRRMRRVHVEEFGWHDIAQHVTVDPDGALWTGRCWSLPPVSASGHNGSETAGPLMIAMIGDFDHGRETPGKAQRESVLDLVATVQSVFGLDRSSLHFHRDIGACRTCPGSGVDLAAWRERLAVRRDKLGASRAGKTSAPPDSPFPVHRARRAGGATILEEDSGPVTLGDEERLAEPPEASMPTRALDILTALPGSRSGPTARGGNRSTLSRHSIAVLEAHVVNLRKGQLSTGGDFDNTADDVDRRVGGGIRQWLQERSVNAGPARIMIHAHGGLNEESDGLAYARDSAPFWIAHDVYPVYIVWETGGVDSLIQIIEQAIGIDTARGRIADWIRERRDNGLEWLVHNIPLDPWQQMKDAAKVASSDHDDAGMRVLLDTLGGIVSENVDGHVELHAVGHSAGAILLARTLDAMKRHASAKRFETLSLLAPACTVGMFRKRIEPALDKRVGHFNLFLLRRQAELADHTVPAYSRSLLYLVRDGFERRRGTPILGLQESIDADRSLKRRLGLGREERTAISVVLAPNADTESWTAMHASAATVHGAFARDKATMLSIAQRIVGAGQPVDETAWASDREGTRSGTRLIRPLADTIDPDVYKALFERPRDIVTMPIAPLSEPLDGMTGNPTVHPPPADSPLYRLGARKRALCIGIDAYPGDARLAGCVNDAEAWRATLQGLGFECETLLDEQATHAAIRRKIGDLVRTAAPGELVVIQYAGHGAWFADKDGDEEDGRDEVLVPVDADGRLFIADDELWNVVEAGSDGVALYMFMDCCHSATNTRAASLKPGVKPRRLRGDTVMGDAHRSRLRAEGRRGAPTRRGNERQRHYKYAACRDDQEAMEENGQGRFTGAALEFLRSADTDTSNAQFCERVLKRFRHGSNQTPHLDCRPEWREAPFLGGLFRQR